MTDDTPHSASNPLADLPLRTGEADNADADSHRSGELSAAQTSAQQRNLFSEPETEPVPLAPTGPQPVPDATPEKPEDAWPTERFKASLLDFLAHLAVMAIFAFGARLLGVRIDRAVLIPLIAATIAFSFLYTVPSLMIWGRTPGMSASGLVAQSSDYPALTAGQALGRWLIGWLNWLSLGLASLANITDRLTGTRTVRLSDNG